ncbi:5-oxoprolinase subunit PxpA [Aquimarina algicola]|uniref:5-oxoprolinase subunit PxpA n=1 Tax=Aquimarina algicola TaxID=2589995 RepID=A0A504J186_9FLAO|nr:5-oxoprolinase subunit PxpA [Aquimarina algicola]TPN82222.1 5-oxoprolinase subunit PxpA [Aquimarina algicola]
MGLIFNADVGEGLGNEAEIMPYISWCNIACGVHAGSDKVIQETIQFAKKHNVKIGAHPSYPDRDNFGRISMKISKNDLIKTIANQIALVKYYTEKIGCKLHHIKPHGALYNDAIKDKNVADAIYESVKSIDKSLKIVTTKESMISKVYRDVFDIKHEVFADRNYNEDLSLVSRSEKKAVIKDKEAVLKHMSAIVKRGKVITKNGAEMPITFDTVCVHGDTPNSVEILKHLYANFFQK